MDPGRERPTPPSGPLWLEVTGFPGSDGWRAGFTTRRAGGELAGVLPLLGWSGLPAFRLSQVHGTRMVEVGPPDDPRLPPRQGDGLLTARRGVILTVASADCVPVVLFDPEHSAGAVLHAGWRGTRSRIAREGVEALHRRFGSRPESLRALLGPAIGRCCYRVGEEVVEEFSAAGYSLDSLFHREEGNGAHLDLSGANRLDLCDAGVDSASIQSVGWCTHCLAGLFPSYRREGSGTSRILTFLGSSPAS